MEDNRLSRDEVLQFLRDLREHFRRHLQTVDDMPEHVKNKATRDRDNALRLEESFVRELVVPSFITFINERGNHPSAENDVKAVLRAEPRESQLKYGLTSAARSQKHPFSKERRERMEDVYARWSQVPWKEKPRNSILQACPDLALAPPYRIVFECKYFTQRGTGPAKGALVESLYETIFYRGLPAQKALKGQRDWSYEYGCFVAYDASTNLRLVQAWQGVRKNIESALWDSGNIFVMIFPDRS